MSDEKGGRETERERERERDRERERERERGGGWGGGERVSPSHGPMIIQSATYRGRD